MMWLTWRQLRPQAMIMFGTLVVLTAFLAITGPRLAHDYAAGTASCGSAGDCAGFTDTFFSDHAFAYFVLTALVLAVPAVIGLFWGAPMISRELETGTHDLVWQQSVTRRRWLAVKIGSVGLAVVVAAGAASVAVSWWARPLDEAGVGDFARLSPLMFDARGFAAVGHAAFAFTLGVTLGLLLRRTLPAMAVTLTAFAIVQLLTPTLVRPHLLAPLHVETAITAQNLSGVKASGPGGTVRGLEIGIGAPGAWILTNQTVDSTGTPVETLPAWVSACMPTDPGKADADAERSCFDRLAASGYRQVVEYQPANRFWALQALETAIFLGLALLLAAVCFWRIRPD